MKVSILMPVYNERTMVERCIAACWPHPCRRIWNASDRGRRSLHRRHRHPERLAASEPAIRPFRHEVNRGKGAAVRSAIQQANGDFSLIQMPIWSTTLRISGVAAPLLDGRADAVFGRATWPACRLAFFPSWHSMINKGSPRSPTGFGNLNLT
jgi:hypothetical protein